MVVRTPVLVMSRYASTGAMLVFVICAISNSPLVSVVSIPSRFDVVQFAPWALQALTVASAIGVAEGIVPLKSASCAVPDRPTIPAAIVGAGLPAHDRSNITGGAS